MSEFDLKPLIPKAPAMEVLKIFEDRYAFDANDNIIYFMCSNSDIEKAKSFDERIKVKFGISREGSFYRRWQAYCHHSTDMPFLIAAISMPNMKYYSVLYPETEYDDLPTLINEEKKIKKLFKDRRYQPKSTEKVLISLNEVCDYFEKRQKELNEMYKKYDDDIQLWRIPFVGRDGKWHDRLEYHLHKDKITNTTENCEDCRGTGNFYRRGKYPNFITCVKCEGAGKITIQVDDTMALKNSIIKDRKKGRIDKELEYNYFINEKDEVIQEEIVNG
jgi:hypothetical protein|tara:strand:+ start:57 stop:881 length:825 start_codon:yes stop_codon:yes gene_type:complete